MSTILSIVLKPFALLLGLLYSATGSYGLSIIIFGLIFKILLFPISIRGRKSMLDMSRLSEKQKDLQQKYGRDRQKYSEELQNLYATENVKPSGGCLWSFLPMPVLMALFFIVNNPFTHLMGLSSVQVTSLTEFIGAAGGKSQLSIAQQVYENFSGVQAALPDVAATITANGGPISFEFFGINLSATPDMFFFRMENAFTWPTIGLILIPVISAVFALLSMQVNMRINKKILGTVTKQDSQNRQMMIIQPVISLWLGFTLPAALSLYWCTNYIFAIAQEYCSIGILKKHVVKMRAEAEQRAASQKEKAKEQKRIAAEQKKKKAEEAQRIKMERRVSSDGISESRVGIRAYAKGRTYDKDRHPVTGYVDPEDIMREQRAAIAESRQKPPADPKKKRKKKRDQAATEALPSGLILNGEGEREPGIEGLERGALLVEREPLPEVDFEQVTAEENTEEIED